MKTYLWASVLVILIAVIAYVSLKTYVDSVSIGTSFDSSLIAPDESQVSHVGQSRPKDVLLARLKRYDGKKTFPIEFVDEVTPNATLESLNEYVWWWLPNANSPEVNVTCPAFCVCLCNDDTSKGRIAINILFWAVDGGFVGCLEVNDDETQLLEGFQVKVLGVAAQFSRATTANEYPALTGNVTLRLIGNDLDEDYVAQFHVPLGEV